MSDWSLPNLLSGLHDDIERQLMTARSAFSHPTTKGDATEKVWLDMLTAYLPQRYRVEKGHVVDSNGAFSDQIDVVIFDRQYSPFIFCYQDEFIIPAESVYAVFEAKQSASAANVKYAQAKIKTVRQLHRTSLPIPHAGGVYKAKTPPSIVGGLLTLESTWAPPLGEPLREALDDSTDDSRLNLGCIAAHGHFIREHDGGTYTIVEGGKPATAFLFNLISVLQVSGTVPMIDIQAYATWLNQ